MSTPAVKPTPQDSPLSDALGAMSGLNESGKAWRRVRRKYSMFGPAAIESHSLTLKPMVGLNESEKIRLDRP